MLLLACLLYIIGAGSFLHLFSAQPAATIFGDEGDGLFNLWILEHTSRYFLQGFQAWSDGQIFWPHQQYSFWWSDNLLTLTPVYALLKCISGDALTAYWWTVQVLSLAVYAMLLWFYQSLYRFWAGTAYKTSWCYWLGLPVWTFLMFFSQIHLHNYLHFQHLAAVWLLLLLTGCVRYIFTRRRRDTLLVGLALLCLIYSAPYYAVLALCLLLGWALVLAHDTPNQLWHEVRRHIWLVLLVGLLAVPGFLAYRQADLLTYAPSVVRELSMQAAHWVTPLDGWLKTMSPELLSADLRPGGYPGLGLLVGLIIAALAAGWKARFLIKRLLMSREFWCWIVLWLITLVNAKEIKWFTCYLRIILIFWALARLLIVYRRHAPARPNLLLLFLAGCGFIIYGTAFGPGELFRFNTIDPSIWGLFSYVVPGYSQMREVIRFAPLGQIILGALVFLAVAHAVLTATTVCTKRLLGLVVAALVALQISETVRVKAPITEIAPSSITLREDETAFYQTISGSMAVLPSQPFHRNTYHMLRWDAHPGIKLLNGYSARSTPEFVRCMELERMYGPASEEQQAYLHSMGVQYVTAFHASLSDAAVHQLQQLSGVLYTNERLTVVQLPTNTSLAQSRNQPDL